MESSEKKRRESLSAMLTQSVDRLSAPESLRGLWHRRQDGIPLPSNTALAEVVELSRSILFPGFYGKSTVSPSTIKYQIGVSAERLQRCLAGQVLAGLAFKPVGDGDLPHCEIDCLKDKALEISTELIARLPSIRETLATDVTAAYNGDPAADSKAEVIACYPAIKALTNYRVAHELLLLGVPLIPRMLSEMAHSETGIDIHPGATIGRYFTIDHGTGVVIGATTVIGNNVKIYQGVTLGAKSFPLDADGNPIKGIPRHPIIGDDVVVYANATVLGRIHIGRGCVVGANVWVTHDLEPGTKTYFQS